MLLTTCRMSKFEKRFVYVLRSLRDQERHYVGWTSNVSRRLKLHNAATKGHTAANQPWQLVVAVEFVDSRTAFHFERYLKSGSGRAFAVRHFGGATARAADVEPPHEHR